MIRVWPRFHDPAYRPSFRENLGLHWQANLRMLRRPRDIALFSVISFLPALVVVGLVTGLPALYSADLMIPAEARRFQVVLLATFLGWGVVQHLAFVHAMELTYVPHVRASLLDRGVPVCPACGDLLPPNDPGAACPECGHRGRSATMEDFGGRATSLAPADDPDTEVPRR